VTAVAFGTGADGRPLLASGSDDKTVRLWDPTTCTPVLKLLRRASAAVVATQRGQLAIADPEGVVVIEVIDGAG
jgi:WD40 repeat protein